MCACVCSRDHAAHDFPIHRPSTLSPLPSPPLLPSPLPPPPPPPPPMLLRYPPLRPKIGSSLTHGRLRCCLQKATTNGCCRPSCTASSCFEQAATQLKPAWQRMRSLIRKGTRTARSSTPTRKGAGKDAAVGKAAARKRKRNTGERLRRLLQTKWVVSMTPRDEDRFTRMRLCTLDRTISPTTLGVSACAERFGLFGLFVAVRSWLCAVKEIVVQTPFLSLTLLITERPFSLLLACLR